MITEKIDILGLRLEEAEKILTERFFVYKIIETKDPREKACVFLSDKVYYVLKQFVAHDIINLIVGYRYVKEVSIDGL